jgi:hypothetical protein
MIIKGIEADNLINWEKRYEQEEKSYNQGFDEICLVCGKGIKDIKKVKMLGLLNGGDILTEIDIVLPQEYENGYIGFYPVGNCCYKKYKAIEKEIEI